MPPKTKATTDQGKTELWPNQTEVPEGVTPSSDIPQTADLFDDSDLDEEMAE